MITDFDRQISLAFQSYATNLVDPFSDCVALLPDGTPDVFLRLAITVRQSVSEGCEQGNRGSYEPSVAYAPSVDGTRALRHGSNQLDSLAFTPLTPTAPRAALVG